MVWPLTRQIRATASWSITRRVQTHAERGRLALLQSAIIVRVQASGRSQFTVPVKAVERPVSAVKSLWLYARAHYIVRTRRKTGNAHWITQTPYWIRRETLLSVGMMGQRWCRVLTNRRSASADDLRTLGPGQFGGLQAPAAMIPSLSSVGAPLTQHSLSSICTIG